MECLLKLVEGLFKNIIEKNREKIATCALTRISCEGWLKVELLHSLSKILPFSEGTGNLKVKPEYEHTDIVILSDHGRIYIELKTFPTNYCGRSGKPITNFIEGVEKDLEKLKNSIKNNDIGISVWMAYPFPCCVPSEWNRHLKNITFPFHLFYKVGLSERCYAYCYINIVIKH